MKVMIIGKGAWGTALASVIEHNEHQVSFWNRKDPIHDVDIVLIAVPVQAIREVVRVIDRGSIGAIINTSKGIDQQSRQLPSGVIRNALKTVPYFTLMGPGFSHEVLKKTPTLVNIGYAQETLKKEIQSLFQTDYFRVHLVKGVSALELAGAFKNIYAIGCGIADGLGYEINTRTFLITAALEEIYGICEKLHYTIEKNSMSGMVGDLVLTCNSPKSRNFMFGKLLLEGNSSSALRKIAATVEGYNTLSSVPYFIKEKGLSLPFAQTIYEIVFNNKSLQVKKAFLDFIQDA